MSKSLERVKEGFELSKGNGKIAHAVNPAPLGKI
jgi:hypothetical protein